MKPSPVWWLWVDAASLFLEPVHRSCVTALLRVGMVSASLVGIKGCLKCKHGLAVLVKEAVAGVPLLSHCLTPLSRKALLHMHTQIN